MPAHRIAYPSFFPFLAGLLFSAACALPGPVYAGGYIFDGVRLVDIESGSISGPQRLMVSEGRIVAAAHASSSQRPFRVIDAHGMFLMPGLAEMHAHVPNTRNMQQVEDVLTLFLAHGITTIRGMLGEPGHLRLRSELERGLIDGPRLMTSGPSLNGQSVSSVEQAIELVRSQHAAGFDFLKLHPGLWAETFAALTETADASEMTYAGHVSLAVGLERALASRQTTIDHLDGYAQMLVPPGHEAQNRHPGFFGIAIADAMDEDRIELWVERTTEADVWNVPTQTLIENMTVNSVSAMLARPAMRWISPQIKQQWQQRIEDLRTEHSEDSLERFVEIRRALIAALHDAGAGLLLGADAPQIMNVPGDSTHHELELLVESGLSPREALATGTTAVARFLEADDHACLNPGCVADLVLLKSNPLRAIEHAREIAGVMRAGQWFEREHLDEKLADIEQRANPTGPD